MLMTIVESGYTVWKREIKIFLKCQFLNLHFTCKRSVYALFSKL